ncbi:hypothetical protein [Candidatus Viadribacter manganicus]|uniref:Uncharacterized protein n=1 Tax=Candidatus Viadribacter manganicus TaxID=1759059 RepID=A0A1B1AL79_9PROT|nr:hypothetical protein [Candidatus Viadribacter manganicus]ANP47304.1 hypothetical protein ATE48_15960 [Candidatus Viadribacter manganicus]
MGISAEEIRQAFRDQLKTLACPHCDTGYTDYAVTWSEAWLEGRHDAMRELGANERDGPVKLRCDLCGGAAVTSVFCTPPEAV